MRVALRLACFSSSRFPENSWRTTKFCLIQAFKGPEPGPERSRAEPAPTPCPGVGWLEDAPVGTGRCLHRGLQSASTFPATIRAAGNSAEHVCGHVCLHVPRVSRSSTRTGAREAQKFLFWHKGTRIFGGDAGTTATPGGAFGGATLRGCCPRGRGRTRPRVPQKTSPANSSCPGRLIPSPAPSRARGWIKARACQPCNRSGPTWLFRHP